MSQNQEKYVPKKERPWKCRWYGCNVRGQPQFTGIHSVLHMGCHKVNCKRCGQTHEFMPA